MTSTVAVEELRVGMYIHLDGGWLSHPFPLSAFRITSNDEIATIRGLGLTQVRWVPERSELPAAGALLDGAAPPVVSASPALSPEEQAARDQEVWLNDQREAAQRSERQYGEAARVMRDINEQLTQQPKEAGRTAGELTRAMLDKMLAAEEVGICLVSSSGGDRNGAHALNVAVVSMLIGRTLGMSDNEMQDMGVGALLHDVGKIDVPDRLRHPEDNFTPAETSGYRDHVAKGVLQGHRMGLNAGALSVIAQHHEHADGSGFPMKLTADRMSAPARIVALVNRYDNLCNPSRPGAALTPHEALSLIFAQFKSRFDSAALSAFIRMMGVYPPGSVVQLIDDRYGIVVSVNSSRPLKPRVVLHEPGVPKHEALILDLEKAPQLGIRRSLKPGNLPPAALDYLAPRQRIAYFFDQAVEPEKPPAAV